MLTVTTAGPVSIQVEAPGYTTTERPGIAVGSDDTLRVELEPTPRFLERVQVTAAKDVQAVGDLAALADVVERSAIEARGDQTLTQAVANIPGLVVSGQAGSFDSVMLRGMPREGNDNAARISTTSRGTPARLRTVRCNTLGTPA